MDDYPLINLITQEEDQEMMRDAEALCCRLGLPKRWAMSQALEWAYLKGKYAGEQGIIKQLEGAVNE